MIQQSSMDQPLKGIKPNIDFDLGFGDKRPQLIGKPLIEALFQAVTIRNESRSFIHFKGQFNLGAVQVKGVWLSPEATQALGLHSVKRLMGFAQLPAGWDNGSGQELNPASVVMLGRFLDAYDDFFGMEPSVFMNYDGFIELAWEDPSNGTIEVMLGDNAIEYYIEALGDEDVITSDDLPVLLEKLRSL
jgi:hypothetical protein